VAANGLPLDALSAVFLVVFGKYLDNGTTLTTALGYDIWMQGRAYHIGIKAEPTFHYETNYFLNYKISFHSNKNVTLSLIYQECT
jgi:hypothetical protein